MRCHSCFRQISKVLQAKMIVDYVVNGETKTYGFMAPDGPLTAVPEDATLLHVYHFKCWQILRKREARGGDMNTGRLLGTDVVPSAYDIGRLVVNRDDLYEMGLTEDQAREQTTRKFTERAAEIRKLAQEAGAAVEEIAERERRQAVEHGGPYEHTHYSSIDRQRLESHLLWAHGHVAETRSYGYMGVTHGELHALMAQIAKQREREADPGHQEPEERDWREQFVTDI